MVRGQDVYNFYKILLKKHGKQGWWPVFRDGRFQYTGEIPDEKQRFVIAISAILTQNTSWKNVEKAVKNLDELKLLDKKRLREIPVDELARAIRSSGYCNQKARKIKEFVGFLDSGKEMTRENLLGVWGIGKETADSILLYAYGKLCFVVDSYTKNVFVKKGLCEENIDYCGLQKLIIAGIPKDVNVYKEFHALLVAEGKVTT